MRCKPNKIRSELDRRAERAVVLQVLRDDHGEQWSRAELEAEIAYIEVSVLDDAVASLGAQGVVRVEDGAVWASAAARCLDELDLICV